jgi:Na+/proline symporter
MVVQQLNNPVVGGLIIGALIMAVMSSADSALNSATAIFVKDLFEHHLGWRKKGERRTLALARLCTAGLGLAAILIAVIWPDIIGLLLFTYHVWAPAIILPVCVGALTRRRSPRLTRNIFITMIGATAITLAYRLLLLFVDKADTPVFSRSADEFMQQLDPAVFGVAASALIFGALSLAARSATPPDSHDRKGTA